MFIFKVKLYTVAIVRIVEIVGGYSISLKELRDILSYLYTGQQGVWVSDLMDLHNFAFTLTI